jgi:hypothetical protein
LDISAALFREKKSIEHYEKETTDERTINTFCQYILYGAGVATPDPGEAPPLAGFNMKSPAASNHTTPYFHQIKK